MEDQVLRSQAHGVLDTLTEDQVRLVLDFCLDLREAIPSAPDHRAPGGGGLEELLEESA